MCSSPPPASPGDTVVAQVGDVDITAAELLYWVAYSADSMLSYYSTYFGITELPWDTEDAPASP